MSLMNLFRDFFYISFKFKNVSVCERETLTFVLLFMLETNLIAILLEVSQEPYKVSTSA